MHSLNQRGGGLALKFEFQTYMSLSTFLAFRNPVVNFPNFLNSRVLLSYKPLSYLKKGIPEGLLCYISLIIPPLLLHLDMGYSNASKNTHLISL